MTLLMVFIAILVQLPAVILGVFAVPCAISLTVALPYLSIRLVTLLTDERERTFRSVELQRVVWTLVVCLFVSSPVVAVGIAFALRW